MSKPESFQTVALSAKALNNVKKLAWPKGAILSCAICLYRAEKTAEQMEQYMKKWPRCCGVPAEVKPKYD